MPKPLNAFIPIPPAARPKPSTTLTALFAAFAGGTILLLFIGGSAIVQYAFPAASVAIGWFLYVRYPAHYLAFVWWLWFLAPEVRRIVDYHIGWNAFDPTVLAPLFAGLPLIFTAVRELPTFRGPLLMPLLMIVAALFYGFWMGVQNAGLFPAGYALWNWLMPVAFFFYLLAHHDNFVELRQMLIRTFVWGGLVMGVYGIIQFFLMPPWDAYWIVSAQMLSIGLPFPQMVRVFSTVNSPGPFAVVVTASLLIIMTSKGRVGWWAAGPVIMSFLLSLVRGAWLGFAVAILYLGVKAGRAMPAKLVGIAVIAVISVPVLLVGPAGDRISQRMSTLSDISEDNSYQTRNSFYAHFLDEALGNPAGTGLGVTGLALKLNDSGGRSGGYAVFDSGLMEVPYVFGWPGTFLYATGFIWLLFVAFGRPSGQGAWTLSGAVVLATLPQIVLGNVLSGVGGMIVWCFLGMVVTEKAYADTHWRFAAQPAE